jgi:hypothetical protein
VNTGSFGLLKRILAIPEKTLSGWVVNQTKRGDTQKKQDDSL